MRKSAFTLIELLVVIAIIAILAAIALPIFAKVLEKGKLSADLNNLSQIGTGLQAYQNDNDGKMPADNGGGTFVVSSTAGGNQVLLNYAGKSYAVWHSKFDPRTGAEGDNYPISYSLNSKVLTPAAAPAGAGAGAAATNGDYIIWDPMTQPYGSVAPPSTTPWNGDFGIAVAPPSKILVASPAFVGNPTNGLTPWTTMGNVANKVNCVTMAAARSMTLTGTFYRLMPCLFADSHVEMVTATNYQNGSAGTGTGPRELDWKRLRR